MFKPQLIIRDLTGGINSKQRANKILDNQLASISGYDFDANTLRSTKGYTKIGTEADKSDTGKTLYKHEILTGQDVLIKTIGTTIKFYDEVDDAWYPISDATLVADAKWAFASFNGYLYGGNSLNAWIFWNGGARSYIASDILIGATTIDVETGHGARFAASGDIMIQGEKISYTGVSGDQLTGVTGVLTNHSSGSTIIQKLNTTSYTGLEKIADGKNTLTYYRGRNYYISAVNPRKILFSKLADATNPETDIVNFTTAGSGSGDAGYEFAPDEVVALKQYIAGSSSAILVAFCKNGVAYSFSVTDGTSTTVSVLSPIRTMGVYPISPNMISVLENDLAFVDQYGIVRTLTYGDTNNPISTQSISTAIEPSLEATYWDNGCMWNWNRKLFVSGASTEAGANDIHYYFDTNYSAWGSYNHWDVVDFAEYNGWIYGLSQVTGDVFKLYDTYAVYVDDVNENYESEYYREAVTKEYDFGDPLVYKKNLKMRVSGFITSECEQYLDVFYDGTKVATFLIDGDNGNITGNVPNVAVGTVVFGQVVFGGGLPSGSVRKEFWTQLQFNDLINFLKLQFRLRLTGKNVDCEISELACWVESESEECWLSNRIITQS